MSGGIFVTGTDTGAGKTFVSCALLHGFRGAGLRAVGMKPVASGCEVREGRRWNEDVEMLVASSDAADRARVNPYLFDEPIAPHIAAQRAGVTIDLAKIIECHAALARDSDVVVVEGVGGFVVPLSREADMAMLAQALALPVVLVVGMRLGCLNHALLTVEAIAARGLRLAGWVANCIDGDMVRVEDNIAALDARIAAPRIGTLPRLARPEEAAGLLDVRGLVAA